MVTKYEGWKLLQLKKEEKKKKVGRLKTFSEIFVSSIKLLLVYCQFRFCPLNLCPKQKERNLID